jgi:hypothetical protein
MIKISSETKNTKVLRLKIYKAMLKKLVEYECHDYPLGFCFLVTEVTNIEGHETNKFNLYCAHPNSNVDVVYKELIAHKPRKTGRMYWFDTDEKGTKKRIQILEEIIQKMETSSKTKKN